MSICNKCKIDQPKDKFETYYHSTRKKFYTRKICTPCMRIGYNKYKFKVKQEKLLIDIQNNPDYKQCCNCMEYKLLPEFYISATKKAVKMCKPCYVKHYKEKAQQKMEENGGRDNYYKEPNRYTSTEQKKQVFLVMEALGWIFDESTGIWNKLGIKENGVFINMVLENKPKRIYPSRGGRKIKSGVWNNTDKIIKLVEEGHTYDDIADIFDCSHTLIRTVVTQYRNEKKSY
jgi:transposase